MSKQHTFYEKLKTHFEENLLYLNKEQEILTIEIDAQHLQSICLALREEPDFRFEMLIDICGVDYQAYGYSEWITEAATHLGFERGIHEHQEYTTNHKGRFAVVYHLLSLEHNQRLRLRTFAKLENSAQDKETLPVVDSVVDIWPAANWYEREAFDLYGIVFQNHPDLRRILTDYGFSGHPFRKDFPLIGHTEVRYDVTQARVVSEPVSSVQARTLVPKVIRQQSNESCAPTGDTI